MEKWVTRRLHVTAEQMEELLKVQTEDDFVLMTKENSK